MKGNSITGLTNVCTAHEICIMRNDSRMIHHLKWPVYKIHWENDSFTQNQMYALRPGKNNHEILFITSEQLAAS